jgi:para-nitrobenzyl esterase
VDTVKIESGYISGTVLGEPGREVHVYRGIPYAATTAGDLRWKPPQPVVSWSGIKECTVYGDAAPQEPPGPPFPQESRSENCLTLNVLTPAKKSYEKLPVMVWLHGGGLVSGCANNHFYASVPLAQHGVVLVGVNHRLGLMGMMAHPLLSKESLNMVSGNYMFLDMIASLKWVQKNIAVFGGDSKNVTIFGESGGGFKVACLMASPLAKGLFHRAIYESGTAIQAPAFGGKSLKELEKTGEEFFARLGVDKEKDPLKAARAIPWQKLLECEQSFTTGDGAARMFFTLGDLAIDGWFLEDTPTNIFKAGKHNAVSSIAGANLGELTGPGMILMPQVIPAYVTQLTCNNRAGSRGYAYIFDQVPAGWKKEGMNSQHGMELNYLFGLSEVSDWENVFPGPPRPNPGLTDADRNVAEAMMKMWAHFAKTGNPSVKGLIDWPSYEADSDRYLYIAEPLQVKTGFSGVGQKK